MYSFPAPGLLTGGERIGKPTAFHPMLIVELVVVTSGVFVYAAKRSVIATGR